MKDPTTASHKIPVLILIVLFFAVHVMLVAPRAHALPTMPGAYFAAAACDLPDGSKGVVWPDNRTCCPASAGTDAEKCLFSKYITPTIQLLSAAVGVLVVISIMYGAFETITAGSDVSKAAAGRKRIIQALIGLGAYLSLFVLLQFLIPGGVV